LETGWDMRMKGSEQGTAERPGSVSRRDFLRAGGAGVVALSAAEQTARAHLLSRSSRKSCIFLLMTGGPSQLDTFDPKPEAPSDYRGPMRTIATAVPGVFLSEGLPKLAQRMGRFSLLRSLAHDAAPIHETGLQLLQTGRLSFRGDRPPHFGSLVARRHGPRGDVPASVVLPRLLTETGVNIWKGQGAGSLGNDFEPRTFEPQSADESTAVSLPEEGDVVRQRYGKTRFGSLCLQARQLVEAGVRCVTVNLFDRIHGESTWDCHGRGPWSPSTVFDYRDTLCPQFDRAVSALLDDLQERGLFDDTLVIATGEFGRTPKMNETAGRDHWPHVWSALAAGGGIHGGEVIGSSDARGSHPANRPTSPAELNAAILQVLGVPSQTGEPTENVAGGSQPAITSNRPAQSLVELLV
jgi:uncharacterized protein (DUF1501 family)